MANGKPFLLSHDKEFGPIMRWGDANRMIRNIFDEQRTIHGQHFAPLPHSLEELGTIVQRLQRNRVATESTAVLETAKVKFVLIIEKALYPSP